MGRDDRGWVPVCRFDDLEEDHGVAVLVHGRAVAVFRAHDGTVHAVANRDPLCRTGTLARGLVGAHGEVTVVPGPGRVHTFDLATGVSRDDPAVRVSTYDVRVVDGVVEVGPRRRG